MPTAAAAMTAVAIHPSALSHDLTANSPITFRCEAICKIIAMIGTAVTPMTTALKISA